MITEQHDKVISILGFRSVKIDDVDSFLRKTKKVISPETVQILDAMHVASKTHLFFAFLNAKKSFEENALSENLGMEILLYASGNRQIIKAIEMLGIKPKTSKIAVIIYASTGDKVKEAENKLKKLITGIRDDKVLDIDGKTKVDNLKKIFNITDLELESVTSTGMTVKEALTWLIVERVALLTVKK